MCCCGKPTINGQLGYRWQPNDPPRVRPVDPPAVNDDETIIYDEPGRCGGCDAHSHHYRVTRRYPWIFLLVRHGGGDVRIKLRNIGLLGTLDALDTNARYWLLHTIYHANQDGKDESSKEVNATWRKAAAEKRIKTRKQPARGTVEVWIEPANVTETSSDGG